MNERPALLCDRFFDRRMAVSKRIYADAAEQVEIFIALLVDDVHTLAANEKDGVPLISGKQQFGFCCANLIEFRHFHLSSGHHHFGAVGYAGTAQVGKGTGRLRG